MWSDNETNIDFLNFSNIAQAAVETIQAADGEPVSIGVSGAWGAGKSSMMKLIRSHLEELNKAESNKYLCVEFNAWLYQGYDDTRAALMEVIASTIHQLAEDQGTGIDKAKSLLKKINWLRVSKLVAGTALPLALGLPPVGLIGEATTLIKELKDRGIDNETLNQLEKNGADLVSTITGLIRPGEDVTPPKEIQAIRDLFEEALAGLDTTLVVFIDDLDRCLPDTTISTLEAVRLFLFLKNTAFVVAADDKMIKAAVKTHFDGIDDELAISYFDKLIQVPIRVPQLGTQDVRAYLLQLFVENSSLDISAKEQIRQKISDQLGKSWEGNRVDKEFMSTLEFGYSTSLLARFEIADQLTHLLTTAHGIRGNPRLIKRFLNALSLRQSIANSHGISIDEKVLVKMLLFERGGTPLALEELVVSVAEDTGGKPLILKEWEKKIMEDNKFNLPDHWDNDFTREWLCLDPLLADVDLRGLLYISREHLPLISPEDSISEIAGEILSALLATPKRAEELIDELKKLQSTDRSFIMTRLLGKMREEEKWGTPDILNSAIAVAEADLVQKDRLVLFLIQIPVERIAPAIVARIKRYNWSSEVFGQWVDSGVNSRVQNAIKR